MLNHIPTFFSKKLPLATATAGTSFRCLPFKALLRLVEDAREKRKDPLDQLLCWRGGLSVQNKTDLAFPTFVFKVTFSNGGPTSPAQGKSRIAEHLYTWLHREGGNPAKLPRLGLLLLSILLSKMISPALKSTRAPWYSSLAVMKKSSTAHSSRRLSSLALFHQPMDVNTMHSIQGRQGQSCPLCSFLSERMIFVSYFRLALWRTWVGVWLCCTVLGGGLLLGTTAAQAAPAKAASAKDVPVPTIPGDTGPATVWSCGGYRHDPSDFTSLSYGGDVGDYDVDGRSCDGSFSYVPTPTSSTVTWPVVVNTADPNGTEVDVWVWIPTLDASAIVNYAVTECKLETTNCSTGYLTQGFNQDPVSGWQFVGTVYVGAGQYVSQFTLSSGDQQQNNMGESAIGITTQNL